MNTLVTVFPVFLFVNVFAEITVPFSLFLYNDTIRNASKNCNEISNCLRKCCDFGYTPVRKNCVLSNSTIFENIWKTNFSSAALFPGVIRCANNKIYLFNKSKYPDDDFALEKDGSLHLHHWNQRFSHDEFCVDYFDGIGFSGLICSPEKPTTHFINKRITQAGMIISMPFLLLTFLVYAVLPDRNLHGKCLMCYVITLFGAYAFLVFIQLYPNDLAGANCKTLGILCFFFFTVSFFWMNVMSIDIWWAFSGLRGFSGSRKEAERKRFILYCGYAWGVSLLLTTIVIGFTVSENVEKNVWYNPGMGDGQCWFRDGVPTLLYFYVPMATIIVVNITLFAVTACKIKRVQQDTAMLRKDESKKHSYENDKQRFNLYLKLMLAMGVNWAMEIVSWIVDWQIGRVPPPVWYLTDFCNALYGVFVFFIFVFKRNIWKLLKRRYYMIMGKPHLARSMTQTAYSPRTTGSSLNHTVSTDKNFVTDSSVLTSEVS
ncbi:G-protein coupled receptor Mth2-like isoform X7 [Photinus pyralis]|uniref:G-protein coupled receptors family 2 profile 2 domain-containing protein n=1 Tax=Photinus pyralis TaxID=7054 RepID=A0A1Y1NI84_PHOPY|nr:G-protein coupled receptor Mth2-like isoform X7 [Photinus pyralis]